jgi:3-oxoacyl-[acyl-carrier-protein] synthase-3
MASPSTSQSSSSPRPAGDPAATGNDVIKTLTGVQILATGSFAPAEIVSNEDLAELGYDAEWIVQRSGIKARRRAASHEATSDIAAEAASNCLQAAGVAASEVDLILLATITPDQPTPSTACHVQRILGCQAPALDIGAACAGFMYAMVTGMQFIRTGTYRKVLVVAAELMSRTVDPSDKKTFPLFGDGAGAVLLGPGSDEQGLLAFTLGADGSKADLLQIMAGGTRQPVTREVLDNNANFLHMDGRAVFKWAVRHLRDSVTKVLDFAGLSADDLQMALFHQANIRIIDAAADNLGIDRDRVAVNLDRYGNTSAASIPLVLDEVNREGRINPGDLVLMSGFGAGLAWGSAIIRW